MAYSLYGEHEAIQQRIGSSRMYPPIGPVQGYVTT